MSDLVYTIQNIVIPIISLLSPFAILLGRIVSNNLRISLKLSTWFKLVFTWTALSLAIFSLLLYLTGDITYLYSATSGLYIFDDGLTFVLFNHLAVSFRIEPGTSLLVVSILSALLYASLLILPPICTYSTENIIDISNEEITTSTSDTLSNNKSPEIQMTGKKSTVSSSITASVSAIASTAVCCSTSVVAVIAPTIVTVLGPFVPVLLYLSMAMLIYSFVKIVLPRFPK